MRWEERKMPRRHKRAHVSGTGEFSGRDVDLCMGAEDNFISCVHVFENSAPVARMGSIRLIGYGIAPAVLSLHLCETCDFVARMYGDEGVQVN